MSKQNTTVTVRHNARQQKKTQEEAVYFGYRERARYFFVFVVDRIRHLIASYTHTHAHAHTNIGTHRHKPGIRFVYFWLKC